MANFLKGLSSSDDHKNDVQRSKYWSELKQEEKIERIREEIKNRDNRISDMNRSFSILEKDFQNHRHLNGELVKPVKDFGYGNEAGLAAKEIDPDEIYF